MRRVKLIILSLSLVMVSVFAFSGIVTAQSVKTGSTVAVTAVESIDRTLFTSGNNVNIGGTINGDVYCAGQNVTISGTVKGDVFCTAQTINISGKVEGSIRLAGQSVVLSGVVGGSATVAAQTFLIEKDGVVQRDLLGGTQNLTINGLVGRDLAAGASIVAVNGQVGRDIIGGVDTLTVGSVGRVGGNLRYTSDNNPTVDVGGQIVGTVNITPPKSAQTNNPSPLTFTFFGFLYTFITMLLVAVVLALLFPGAFNRLSAKAIKSPGRIALTGLIGVIVVPVLVGILLVSVIGSLLGALALLIWLVVVMLSGPFVGYMLGRLILRHTNQPVINMLMGAGLLLVLYFIPILGFFVMLSVYIFGVGMLIDEAIRRRSVPVKKTS